MNRFAIIIIVSLVLAAPAGFYVSAIDFTITKGTGDNTNFMTLEKWDGTDQFWIDSDGYVYANGTKMRINSITCGGTDKISAWNNVTGLFTCTTDSGGAGSDSHTNLGSGEASIALESVGSDHEFKTLEFDGSFTVTNYTNRILVNFTGGGSSVTSDNLGSGDATILIEQMAGNVDAKRLRAGDGITLGNYSNTILINSTASGTLEGLTNTTNTGCKYFETLAVNKTGFWDCSISHLLVDEHFPKPLYNITYNFQTGKHTQDPDGTYSNDTYNFVMGDRSTKIVTNGDSATINTDITFSTPLDLSNYDFNLLFRFDEEDNLGSVTMIMGDGGFGNYFQCSASSALGNKYWDETRPNKQDWNWMHLALEGDGCFVGAGAPDPSNITILRLRINDNGTPLTYWYQAVALTEKAKEGFITMWWDDSRVSAIEQAAYLYQYGFPSVEALIPNNVGGGADKLTIENITTLRDVYGWEIAAHHETDPSLISDDEVLEDMLETKQWLIENGFPESADLWVFPGGNWNFTQLENMKPYFSMGRGIGQQCSSQPPQWFPLEAKSFGMGESVASIKARIDNCMAQKGWLNIVWHTISAAPADSTEYDLSDFREVIDYIYTQNYDVVTVTDAVYRMGYNGVG